MGIGLISFSNELVEFIFLHIGELLAMKKTPIAAINGNIFLKDIIISVLNIRRP